MGINPEAIADDSAMRIAAAQDAIFDKIVARRRCLPIDLMRMPAGDLMELVKAETGGLPPIVAALLQSLGRYAG
jgi:hypothetical protein